VKAVKLSDQELATLLDEIVHAVRDNLPISDALARLAANRLGRVGRVSRQMADQLRAGGSLADAMLLIKSPSSKLIAATVSSGAIQDPDHVANYSDRLGHVNADLLGLLASRIRSRSDAARISRLMWFYPVVLVGIAYAAVMWVVVPLIREYRFHVTDQPLGIHWSPWLVQCTDWLGSHAWIAPVVFGLAVLMGYLISRRRPILGGPIRKSLFCHALADQLGEGVPESKAILVASSLSDYAVSGSSPTLNDPAVRKLLDQVGGVSDDQVSDDEDLRVRAISTAAQLRYLGNLFQYASRRHLRCWSVLLPQVATIVFGFVFMTGYVWFVLAPIYFEVAHW
jgi:hypothetical protein